MFKRVYITGIVPVALFAGLLGLIILPCDAVAAEKSLSVIYDFSRPAVTMVGEHVRVSVEGCRLFHRPGEPVLPFRTARILLPPGHGVQRIDVRIMDAEEPFSVDRRVAFGRTPLPPSASGNRISHIRSLDRPKSEIYDSDKSYPSNRAYLSSVQKWCGYRIAIIPLFPVQYRPESGRLIFCARMRIEVTLCEEEPLRQDVEMLTAADHSALLAAFVDNPAVLEEYAGCIGQESFGTGVRYDYLLVTSAALLPAFQPLIDLKTGEDLRVRTEPMENIRSQYSGVDDAQKLRRYIRDAYLNWGIRYVLLGGDVDIVPWRGVYGYSCGAAADTWGEYVAYDIPCDLYFGCLDGPWNGDGDYIWGEPNDGEGGGDVDLFAEVFVGRAPVENTGEVNRFVQKVIRYETAEHPRIREALFLAEYLGSHDGCHGQGGDCLDRMLPFFSPFRLTWLDDRPYHEARWDAWDCVAALNASPHLVAHDGHAHVTYCMRMRNEHVAYLNNTGIFFANSTGCLSGAFDREDCIAEELIKQSEHGAFAVLMNSRYGWFEYDIPWLYSTEFQEAMFGHLLTKGHPRIGMANQLSKHDLVATVETSGSMTHRWCYFELNLLGDPHQCLQSMPPETTITCGPEGTVNSPVLTFTFSGSDDLDPPSFLKFSCRLDEGPWSSYSGSRQVSFSNLSEGAHRFQVRALDTGENMDLSPAECHFCFEPWQGGDLWNHLVTGPGAGPINPPLVRTSRAQWLAYHVLKHGVNVACGNLDGSGTDRVVTGPGPGEQFGPHVRGWTLDGIQMPGVSFLAYGTRKFGVNVSCGDVDHDGFDEIVTGAGHGPSFGPHVRGWNCDGGHAIGMNGVNFMAYGTNRWGVNVSCGDVDHDGYDEIITGAGPGPVFGPHVRGWNCDGGTGTVPISGISFFSYGTHRYGVNIACGDLDGDGTNEIITGAGPGSVFSAHVRAWKFNGSRISPVPGVSYLAYPSKFGVVVAAGDVDQDGREEILTMPGPGAALAAHARAWNVDGGTVSSVPSVNSYAYDAWMTYGGKITGVH